MAARKESGNNYRDDEKFTILYNKYSVPLKRKAYHILKDNGWSEDAVQMTFMKIIRHMDKVDDPFSDRTRCYLYTILINTCYSIMKRNNRYYVMDDYTMQMDYSLKLTKRDDSMDHLICEDLLNDIRKVPAIYSNLLILYAVYNYSLTEISAMLELKPATVRKRIQRARKMLADIKERYKL